MSSSRFFFTLVLVLAVTAIQVIHSQTTSTIRPTHITTEDEEYPTTTEEEGPDARKAAPARGNKPTDVCTQVSGCNCENPKELHCDCRKANLNNPLKFKGVTIPRTLEKILITRCDYVELDNPQFSKINDLKLLSVSSATELRIHDNSLSKLDHLSLKDIQHVTVDKGALNDFEASEVRLNNVTFNAADSEDIEEVFRPREIRDLAEFTGCTFPAGFIIELEDPMTNDVTFHGCHFKGPVEMKIKTLHFEMKESDFSHPLPQEHAIHVNYISSMKLSGNTYQKTLPLPDLSSRSDSPTDVQVNLLAGKNATKIWREWLRSFKLDDGQEKKTGPMARCNQTATAKKADWYSIDCPNVAALDKYTEKEDFSSLPFKSDRNTARTLPPKSSSSSSITFSFQARTYFLMVPVTLLMVFV